MPQDARDRAYDVALSFAGEDRPYVERVATALQERGVRVFYDRYEEVSLWGQNLYTRLQIVYSQQAAFMVMFVSKAYAAKLWTNREREYAQERALQERGEYILPARFDDTEVPGLLKTTAYVDLREKTPEEFANLILQKLRSAGTWKDEYQIEPDHAVAKAALPAPTVPASQPARSTTLTWTQAVAVIILILMLAGLGVLAVRDVRSTRRSHGTTDLAKNHSPFVVAVAPFYGPDAESAREGRLMAAIIERAVGKRLSTNARVLGIEDTASPIRKSTDARLLGEQLGADAVIWGEVFAVPGEAEIKPHVTVMNTPDDAERPVEQITGEWARFAGASLLEDKSHWFEDEASPVVKLTAAAPDQIELRRTSISRIADLLLVIAGIDALENRNAPRRALAVFEQAAESPDLLRLRIQALVRLGENDRARLLLERLVAIDPADARGHALLGDLHLTDGRETDAIAAYRLAAASGGPYTSTRGIFYDDKLYLTETYQTPNYGEGKQFQTLFLLAMDPASRRIVERHSMAGLPRSFRVEDGALVIGVDTSVGESKSTDEVRLRDGKFDKPLWPGPNLGRRMHTIRGGCVLASNFLADIERPRDAGEPPHRFILGERIDPRLPSTLPDLERALRAALQRDPTQPWHRFLLALTLREMKRSVQADAMIDEIVRREDRGVPYYHFSWMLTFAMRIDEQRWLEPLWRKVTQQRKQIPTTPDTTTLIERLINAQFVRAAATDANVADDYSWLQRVRGLTGVAHDAEDLVAAVWARHFRSLGDRAAAERELGVFRRAAAHPCNLMAAAARSDHALTAVASASCAFFGLVLLVSITAYWRCRVRGATEARPSLLDRLLLAARRIGRLRPVVRTMLATLIFVLVAPVLAVVVMAKPVATTAIIGVIVAFHLLRVPPRDVLTSVTPRERRTVAVAYLLLLCASAWLVDSLLFVRVVLTFPFGIADSIGHPRVAEAVEKELRRRNGGDTALRYAAAMVNHYGGNDARAAELYGSLPQTYGGTAANRAALARGSPPAVELRSEELFRAFAGTRLDRWRRFNDLGTFEGTLASALALDIVAVFIGGLIVTVLFAIRLLAPVDVPATTMRRIGALLLPGLDYVRQGRVWSALILLLLAGVPILPLVVFGEYGTLLPAHGLFTSKALPKLSAFPLPTEWTPATWATMVLAYPYGWLFSGIVISAFVAAVTLHLWRVAMIVRAVSRRPDSLPDARPSDTM